MDSFPLLSLQPDLREKIVMKFKLRELFELAHCSEKTKKIVKQVTRSLKDDGFRMTLNVSLDRTKQIELYYGNSYAAIRWFFFDERDPERLSLRNPDYYTVDEVHIELCADEEEENYGCRNYTSTRLFLGFVRHLIDILNADQGCLYISPTPAILDTLLASSRNILCPHCFEKVTVEKLRVSHEDMHLILNSLNEIEKLDLQCIPGADFECNEVVSASVRLVILYSAWMKRKNFDLLRCRRVEILRSRFKDSDINYYLHKWMNSTEDIVLQFAVSKEYVSEQEFDWDQIMRGIPTVPEVPKHTFEANEFIPSQERIQKAVDIRRPSDDKLATAMIHKQFNDVPVFLLAVWEEKDE